MDWPGKRVFVSEVRLARAAVALISTSGSWRLRASGDAEAIQSLSLAKAGVELSTVQGQGYLRQLSVGSPHPVDVRVYGKRWYWKNFDFYVLGESSIEGSKPEVGEDDFIELRPKAVRE